MELSYWKLSLTTANKFLFLSYNSGELPKTNLKKSLGQKPSYLILLYLETAVGCKSQLLRFFFVKLFKAFFCLFEYLKSKLSSNSASFKLKNSPSVAFSIFFPSVKISIKSSPENTLNWLSTSGLVFCDKWDGLSKTYSKKE